MKTELSETERIHLADRETTSKLNGSCAIQASEWEERQRVRTEELVVSHDAIQLSNDDDDSLELFKETLPSPALKGADLTKVRSCGTPLKSPTVQEQVIVQEIPQVQFVHQGCRHASSQPYTLRAKTRGMSVTTLLKR